MANKTSSSAGSSPSSALPWPMSPILSAFPDHPLFVPALVTTALLLVSTLLFFLSRKLRTKADTVLFVGLPGSGKTTVFTRLINSKSKWTSYMSLKENSFSNFTRSDGKVLKLVDFPGAESFRNILFQRWMTQERNSLKSVVFIIDSVAFNKKDVAEFLYDVFLHLDGKVALLIVANKQDIGHAKSAELIKKSVEREFGLINVSRKAALSSTDGAADSVRRVLTDSGEQFSWADLPKARGKGRGTDANGPQLVECSAHKSEPFSLQPLREWIDAI